MVIQLFHTFALFATYLTWVNVLFFHFFTNIWPRIFTCFHDTIHVRLFTPCRKCLLFNFHWSNLISLFPILIAFPEIANEWMKNDKNNPKSSTYCCSQREHTLGAKEFSLHSKDGLWLLSVRSPDQCQGLHRFLCRDLSRYILLTNVKLSSQTIEICLLQRFMPLCSSDQVQPWIYVQLSSLGL